MAACELLCGLVRDDATLPSDTDWIWGTVEDSAGDERRDKISI